MIVGSVIAHVQAGVSGTKALAGSGVRGARRALQAAPSEKEMADSLQIVTLQHCDGHGPYRVVVTGTREAANPADYMGESKEWQEFWKKNGAPPDQTKSLFNIGAQYVAYPTLPADASEAEASGSGVEVAAGKGATRYHLHVASEDAPPLRTPCDVLRAAQRVTSVEATTAVDGRIALPLPADADAGRAYVLAESDGGAYVLYSSPDDRGVDVSHGLGAGAIFGIVLLLLCVVAAIVVGLLFYLKKAGKITTRLPAVRNGKVTLA
jgi:hypothetical protein